MARKVREEEESGRAKDGMLALMVVAGVQGQAEACTSSLIGGRNWL